jgi:putative membrane protein
VMYGMTYASGTIGMLVTLLFQGGHEHEMGGGFWELWFLLPILFWGGLVVLIAWLVVRIFPKVRGDERPGAPRDSAEEILRERFARGEITAEEYEKSLEILRGGTVRSTPEDDAQEDV